MMSIRPSGPKRRELRVQSRVLLLFVALLGSVAPLGGCADPYMNAAGCTEFCRLQGKSVESFVIGAQIPIVHPRPSTRCVCSDRQVAPSSAGQETETQSR